MKRRRVIVMVCVTAAVTACMVLAKTGVIPACVFYTALIAMHVWIFTRLGMRLCKLKKNSHET